MCPVYIFFLIEFKIHCIFVLHRHKLMLVLYICFSLKDFLYDDIALHTNAIVTLQPKYANVINNSAEYKLKRSCLFLF